MEGVGGQGSKVSPAAGSSAAPPGPRRHRPMWRQPRGSAPPPPPATPPGGAGLKWGEGGKKAKVTPKEHPPPRPQIPRGHLKYPTPPPGPP